MAALIQYLTRSRRLVLACAAFCLVSACFSPAETPASPSPTALLATQTEPTAALTGQWMGAAKKSDGTSASIQVLLSDSGWKLNVEPFTALWDVVLEQNNEAVHFSAAGGARDPFQQLDFTGTISNNVLQGVLTWDGTKSEITFTSLASLEKNSLQKYEGIYRFDSGRVLSIIVSPEYSWSGMNYFSQTLMLTDFKSGDLRSLYPLDESTFAVGVLRVQGAPFDGRVQFITNGNGDVEGLNWWNDINDTAPSSGQFAERIQYSFEDVPFISADGTQLMGRLTLPNSTNPVPAIMQLHGSEPGTRDNFGAKVMMHFMVSQGFAILNYDKRGVGDSQGVYQESASTVNLQRHASDAIAGVEYLKSRAEIDPNHIGLIGGSQAGWVIPLAASQSDAITYFVIISGPVTSTHQEDVFSSYTNDGESDTTYDDAKITQQLREMSPSGFDPIPILQEVEQPGLWLWGSVDKNQPVTFDAENLQAIIDTGKDNFSYVVFPNGDHNLNETPHGLFAEMPFSPRVLFYSMLAEWLKDNISKEK